MHEIAVKAVCDIQAQTIDIKFCDPFLDTRKKVIDNRRILEIQFDQFKMSFPALVPESIIVAAVSVKTDMEPVFVSGIPFVFSDIFKSPEISSNMIEDTVQHNLNAMCME